VWRPLRPEIFLDSSRPGKGDWGLSVWFSKVLRRLLGGRELRNPRLQQAALPASKRSAFRMCYSYANLTVENRIRHVKCDEKKPNCHRCKGTGRKCDWMRRASSIFIGSNVETITVSAPIQQLPGTPEEGSYFHFFCTRTTLQLSGLFGSTFWIQEVLQACVSHPAIWHASVAVASLQQERRHTICKTAEGDEPLSEFTLSQYVKAMQHLRGLHRQPRPAAEVVLLCCILFICFEVR
jgi:hypothetical protein